MKPTTIKNLHIDLKGGQLLKITHLLLRLMMKKYLLNCQSKMLMVGFDSSLFYGELEIKGKTSLSLGMVKKTLKLDSFIYQTSVGGFNY